MIIMIMIIIMIIMIIIMVIMLIVAIVLILLSSLRLAGFSVGKGVSSEYISSAFVELEWKAEQNLSSWCSC